MPDTEVLDAPKTEEKVNIFDQDAKKIMLPAEVANEVKADPTIKEKDKKIAEEKPVVTKTNEPEKIPTATPKDIPARTEKEKEDIKPASELKFANETSEKIFNLLKEGKEDDVFEFLNTKKTLASIDKMPAAEVIKLQLARENKDYTPSEINDLFNDTYIQPEKPEQKDDETDEEFQVREKKYDDKVAKLERKIEREAKSSKTELLKQQQDLVLPDIQKAPQPNQPTQEELDKTAKARENYLTSIDEGLTAFKSIDAIYKDKDVEIPVAYKISADERKELKNAMENFNLEQFIQERWLTEDGKFNTAQQAKDIFLLTQGDKAIAKIVNETATKMEREVRKAVRNVDYPGTSKSGNFAPNVQEEVDKAARHFFAN